MLLVMLPAITLMTHCFWKRFSCANWEMSIVILWYFSKLRALSIRKRCNNQTWRRRYEQGTCNWFLPNAEKTVSKWSRIVPTQLSRQEQTPMNAKRRLHIRPFFSDTGCAIWISIQTFVCCSRSSNSFQKHPHCATQISRVWSNREAAWSHSHGGSLCARAHSYNLINVCNTSMWSRKEMKLTRSD